MDSKIRCITYDNYRELVCVGQENGNVICVDIDNDNESYKTNDI